MTRHKESEVRTVISVKTASGIEYTEEEFNNITVQIKREVKRVLKEQDLTMNVLRT